jgi:hypothetical protein
MAQGHAGVGAAGVGGGAAVAHAGGAVAAGGVRGGAVSAHAVGAAGASANHYVYARNASGQLVLRRASAMNGVARGRSVGTGTRTGVGTTRRRNGVAEFSGDDGGVPGLGFDYAHLAATRPNQFRGRRDRGNGAVLFPFFDGGYFVPTGTDVVAADNGGGEGPLVDDSQVAEDEGGPVDRPGPRARSLDRMPVVDYGPPAPQPDVPEYVFVRRDGTVFFAVAYSWEQGSLKYVSSEGLRRTVAREKLDLGATQQFNEQRGMVFRAPAA